MSPRAGGNSKDWQGFHHAAQGSSHRIDKKVYPELQAAYCADPNAGPCPCYHVGDTFLFARYGAADDFWHGGLRTLCQTAQTADGTAGGEVPHCSEAWDAISRYIYAGLQGGSLMRGWMREENTMIACCSDGTRPVLFRIERLDYKAVYPAASDAPDAPAQARIREALCALDGVTDVQFPGEFFEVYMDRDVPDAQLSAAIPGGAARID